MGRRIIVTGGAGFLGRHLCHLLADRGDEPFSVDLSPSPDAFAGLQGSVTDQALWDRLPPADGIIHAAALTDLWRRDQREFERVNVGGSRLALRYAERRSIRLLLVSSYTASMRGRLTGETELDHEAMPDPAELIGAYARSKRKAEILCRQSKAETVVVRPTAPIGPGDHGPTPPMRLVGSLVGARLPGVMRGRINIVDIRDLAAGVLGALDRGVPGATYVLSGHDLGLKRFAGLVAAEAGVAAPALEVPAAVATFAAYVEAVKARLTGTPPAAPIDGVRLAALAVTFSARRAQSELGFAARPLAETIRDAVAFARQEGEA